MGAVKEAKKKELLAALEAHPVLQLNGNDHVGEYELTRDSIRGFLSKLDEQNVLKNGMVDGDISIGKRGIDKLLSYGMANEAYKKLFMHIPKMLQEATAFPDYKSTKNLSKYDTYKDLVVGIELDGDPYTVRILLGKRGKYWYYSHFLTKGNKNSLIAAFREPNAGGNKAVTSSVKDTRLIETLLPTSGEKSSNFFERPIMGV